jgi:hypothetical protein
MVPVVRELKALRKALSQLLPVAPMVARRLELPWQPVRQMAQQTAAAVEPVEIPDVRRVVQVVLVSLSCVLQLFLLPTLLGQEAPFEISMPLFLLRLVTMLLLLLLQRERLLPAP